MSTLPAHVKELLDAVYGARWGEAYFEWGTFPAPQQFSRQGKGRAADVAPPDSAAVFWSAGLFKPGAERGNDNVEVVKVFVVDDVGTAPKSKIDPGYLGWVMPEPTIMVESSPGNWQWQWGITDGLDRGTYAALRAGMPFQSDATAPSNLIRLPMGISGKPGVTHRVAWSALGPVYAGAEFIRLCGGLKVSVAAVKASAEALRAPSLPEVAAALKALPNDWKSPYCNNHAAWITFGMALYGATGGEKFDLWEIWNEGQKQKRDLRYVWDSFHSTGLGWVKLRWLAREYGAAVFEAELKALASPSFNDNPPPPDEDEDDAVEALQRDVANLIVRAHGVGIRFNVSTSMWHQFSGVWKESPHDLGYRLAKRWADANAPLLGPKARERVSKSSFYEGVSKILRSDPAIAVVKTDFDRDDWLLGTPGGTVELRTGVLRASTAAEMISLSCVAAPSETENCPKWKAFIDWACTDPATKKVDLGMRKMLRQWAGYCLTGDVTREMVMFFHGGGANGKGSFIETMQWVLGDYFHMAAKDLFIETKGGAHTEEIAVLAGKRMVCADEVPTNSRWNESLLKGVSGGGTISSRHLYGKAFTFPIKFKVTIIGNEKPRFQGNINDALERRLHLVAFRMKADPIIDSFKAALRGEAAGILRWAIGGLTEMLKEGELHIADSSLTATKEYFNENDHFGEWLSENTEPTPGRHGPSSELFKNWKEWVFGQGHVDPFNDQRKFKAEMIRRGKVWRETNKGNVFNDLSIKIFDSVQKGGG